MTALAGAVPRPFLLQAQCSACLFHQSPDRVSLMAVRELTNLLQSMASSGTLSTIVMSLSWGHSCGFLGVSLALGFSLARKWPFLSKHLFCYPPPTPKSGLQRLPAPSWLNLVPLSSCPSILKTLPPVYTGGLFYFPFPGKPCISLWAFLVIYPLWDYLNTNI